MKKHVPRGKMNEKSRHRQVILKAFEQLKGRQSRERTKLPAAL